MDLLQEYPDALVLTVTRRLALRLKESLVKEQKKPVISRSIFSLQDWYLSLWQMFSLGSCERVPQILSSIQEQALWLKVIIKSGYGDHLMRPRQTAKQMMQTWKLLCEWRLNSSQLDWGQQEESLICMTWIKLFEESLANMSAITKAQMPNILLEKIENNNLFFQAHIPYLQTLLCGFDDYTPQFKAWLEWLETKGLLVKPFEPLEQAKALKRFAFQDTYQEITYIAKEAFSWAKENKGTFAIVIPELINMRAQVEQIFNQVCDPSASVSPDYQVSWQFNISAGLPLTDYPIIQVVQHSFKLLQSSISLHEINCLLHSPFLSGGLSEQEARHDLSANLWKAQKLRFTIEELLAMPLEELPILKKMIQWAYEHRKEFVGEKPIIFWRERLLEWLTLMDWPGERALNSPEHQIVQRFYIAIKEWSCLRDAMSWFESHAWLMSLCLESTFQPESHPVKIQIMGLLEASGQRFDKLWVMGMNNEIWPAKPAPNPFIPLTIQIENNMPHSCAHRELVFAQHLTATLMSSAPEVTFSHALQSEGKHYQPSPFIEFIPSIENVNVEHQRVEDLIQKSQQKVRRVTQLPIPLKLNEKIKGGTQLIEAQSHCPFKAFATYRLHLHQDNSEKIGISPLERGSFLHAGLELVWKELKNSERLNQLSESDLEKLIDLVLQQLATKEKVKPNMYWQLESRRLKLLMKHWLLLEKERKPFKIWRTEASVQVQLKDLTLNCRLDRVDLTDDGSTIIIDYKSGAAALKDCFGERPDAPQLPLYCFADFPKNPNGVVFAQIKRQSCLFIGVTELPNTLPKVRGLSEVKLDDIPSQWSDLLSDWKIVLDKLSTSFVEGEHRVSPKSEHVCQYCHLPSLCRVMEHRDE